MGGGGNQSSRAYRERNLKQERRLLETATWRDVAAASRLYDANEWLSEDRGDGGGGHQRAARPPAAHSGRTEPQTHPAEPRRDQAGDGVTSPRHEPGGEGRGGTWTNGER
ncbi:unnamed protein product [Lampetra fluviatilis]